MLLAVDLKPLHVTHWLDAHDWKGGQRNAVTCVKRAFNCAETEGVLAVNPLKRVKKPTQHARTRILTEAEKKEILGAIRDKQLREFVFTMQETGARPGDASVEAHPFRQSGRDRFQPAGPTGSDRTSSRAWRSRACGPPAPSGGAGGETTRMCADSSRSVALTWMSPAD